MKYEKFSFNGVNLYLIKTKDFKKITMRMSFRSPAVKKEITINNFLSRMLIYSTKNYPTSRLLSIRLQELYDMVISYDNYIIGNYLFNDFSASIINERYAEAGNLEKSISLFLETIFDPNIKSKKFDEKSFNVKRMQIKDTIDSIKENKGQYAIIRTKEIMDPKAPYSYIIKGYQSDLDKITPASLYKYYVKWLHNTQLDIYIAGDFDSEKVKSILQHKVPLNVDTTFNIPLIYNHLKLPKRTKKHFEIADTEQAKLMLGFKLERLTDYERQYIMPLYNIILGGTPTSKLFKTVREKHSLCYAVNSHLNLLSHIMDIRVGISKEKYAKTVHLIKKLMKEMANGEIEPTRLEEAKTLIIEHNKKINDNLNSMIDQLVDINLFKFDDIDIEDEKIKKVTIEEIKEVSKKIVLDTIYMLHGGDKHGNN